MSTIVQFQDSYTTVERIVDMQRGGEEEEFPDYYVKWKNLPYAGEPGAIISHYLKCEYWSSLNLILLEATWENGKLIEELCQEQIRAYKEREESRCDFFSRFHM